MASLISTIASSEILVILFKYRVPGIVASTQNHIHTHQTIVNKNILIHVHVQFKCKNLTLRRDVYEGQLVEDVPLCEC